MKRKLCITLILVYIFILSGCSSNLTDSSTNSVYSLSKNEESSMAVDFESGIFPEKDWNESVGTYTGDAIPDKETALSVATTIFERTKNSSMSSYIPQNVFFDVNDQVWIVSFWEEPTESGLYWLGDCYSIALQKKDGKVLRMWAGE